MVGSVLRFPGSFDDITIGIPALHAHIGRLVALFDLIDTAVNEPIPKCKNSFPARLDRRRYVARRGPKQRWRWRGRCRRRAVADDAHDAGDAAHGPSVAQSVRYRQ